MIELAPIYKPSQRIKYSIIIVSSTCGRRMKSYGPTPLLKVGNENILSRQIKIIKQLFKYYEIILVGGFQINKIKKNIKDIKIIENKQYENTNVAHSISLGLNKVKTDRVLIIYGDLVFNYEAICYPYFNESVIITSNNMKEEDVGCVSKNNLLEHMFFSLPNKWGQIGYFTGLELQLLQSICSDQPLWFGFECYNEIVKRGGSFRVIQNKDSFCTDVDSVNDLKKVNNEFINKTVFWTQ